MENADPKAPFGWLPGKENYRPYRHITDCALYHANVRVRCCRCRSTKVFNGHALWWLFFRKRWDDALRTAGRRFRCLRCNYNKTERGRSRTELMVTQEEPTGTQPPMPDERTWKALRSRHR